MVTPQDIGLVFVCIGVAILCWGYTDLRAKYNRLKWDLWELQARLINVGVWDSPNTKTLKSASWSKHG